MKKNFITIFAIGLSLIACKKEAVLNEAGTAEDVMEYNVPVCVSISQEELKAYYNEGLVVEWENNDQILAMKGKITAPGSNTTVTHTTTEGNHLLTLTNNKGTSADFEGDVTTAYGANAIWHFVYPASAGTMETSVRRYYSLGTRYENTTTVSVDVPSEQNGLWIPYSYCASENVSDEDLPSQSITFRPLSACYAVRLFEENGTTPKKAKKVALISDTNNLVGTYKGASTVSGQTAIAPAVASFTFNGTDNTIEANVEGVAATQDGVYEYRLNVPAGNLGELTLQITDENDKVITRSIPALDLAAGHMKAFKVKWNPAGDNTKVEFSISNPKTTYGYYHDDKNIEKANSAGMANSIFDGEVRFNATATQGVNVKEYGIKYLLDKSEFSHEDSDIVILPSWKDPSGITMTEPLSFSFSISGISLGKHTLRYVAYVIANGSTFYSDVRVCEDFVITGLPYTINPSTWNVAGNYGWTSNKSFEFGSDSNDPFIKIANAGGNGWMQSPSFYCMNGLNVNISCQVKLQNRSNTVTLRIGQDRNLVTGTGTTDRITLNTSNLTKSPVMEDSNFNFVQVHYNGKLSTSLKLYEMTILYR